MRESCGVVSVPTVNAHAAVITAHAHEISFTVKTLAQGYAGNGSHDSSAGVVLSELT